MNRIELPYRNNSSELFSQLLSMPFAAYLDSCQPYSEQGRFDILTADPYVKIISDDHQSKIITRSEELTSRDNPFTLLQSYLPTIKNTDPDLPFIGGALGYFSYDLGWRLEKLPRSTINDTQHPTMLIGIYDWAIIFDHLKQKCTLVSHQNDPNIEKIIESVLTRTTQKIIPPDPFKLNSEFSSNTPFDKYEKAFQKLKYYIVEGDCYEANLTQRFTATYEGDPFSAYLLLRQENPSPFAAYLNYPDHKVLSCSPERFLKLDNNVVEAKPIKGTRPRHADPKIDKKMANELLRSEKDRAENLMIVDLLRNDLSRTCQPGTVKVPSLFELESFPAVHHLVSTVTGVLADDKTAIDLLKNAFPGGSITGAPKIRTMEIIEELESHRRGIYCGSIGYISYDQNMDTNIIIRTLLVENNTLFCGAGGAIVADSEVHAEYQECHDKVGRIFKILKQ